MLKKKLMLHNYIKIALRNLVRTKVYSAINILGLSMGVACSLVLFLFVFDEFSYDRHHNRLADLYRINTRFEANTAGFDKLNSVSPPVTMTLKEELAEIESAVRMVSPFGGESQIQYNDKIFYERGAFVADSTLFDVFTYEFTEGSPKDALTEANTIVISDLLAKKLFGDESALNKNILISQGNNSINFEITGVFKTQKSFLKASFFISMMSEGTGDFVRNHPDNRDEWAGQNFVYGFLKLTPNHSVEVVERKINEILVKYGADDMKSLGISKTMFLEPVKDIYLKSQTDRKQRITTIYLVVSIAALILLLGCVNFINLTTAKAVKRASEIGVRKAIGAVRSNLIQQVLAEVMILISMSVLIGLILAQLILPFFNELAGKELQFDLRNLPYIAVALSLLAGFLAIFAGLYPSLYLSSFKPVEVLKGKFPLGLTGKLRQGLVVFQFAIAIALSCGMFIISKQLSFIKAANLGFSPDQKIIIPMRTAEAKKKYEPLKNNLMQVGTILDVSATNFPPGFTVASDIILYPEGGGVNNAVVNRRNRIDAGYFELLDIKLIAGRNFTNNRQAESQGQVILNRTSAKSFDIEPEKIIGHKFYFEWHERKFEFQVIGVVEDFNQTSLRDPILPTMFEMSGTPDNYEFMVASVSTNSFLESIESVEKIWKEQVNNTPFEYEFLDVSLGNQYREDQRLSKIITSFSVIAMIICCLGLYGLSSYMSERRLKEIGVRKVLGASVSKIVTMMSGEFLRLVLIASIAAVPLAWYAAEKWLQNFQYRTGLGIAPFLYACVGATLVALLTVSFESFKAASVNPVKTLRNE